MKKKGQINEIQVKKAGIYNGTRNSDHFIIYPNIEGIAKIDYFNTKKERPLDYLDFSHFPSIKSLADITLYIEDGLCENYEHDSVRIIDKNFHHLVTALCPRGCCSTNIITYESFIFNDD
jgi:hypothetical protein